MSSKQLRRGLIGLAALGICVVLPSPAGLAQAHTGITVLLAAGRLSHLDDDDTHGNADGATWLADTHTVLITKPGTYVVDGIVPANLRIAASAGTVEIAGRNKRVTDTDFDIEAKRARFFNQRTGGDGGAVSVGASGTVDAPGYLKSALVAVYSPNAQDPTNPDSAVQAASDNQARIDIHNLTVFGDGQNAIRPLAGNTGGRMSDLVVVTPPFGVSHSRPRGSGGGGVEIGRNGSLRDSFLKVGDDAVKPKMRGARAHHLRVVLQDSGSAVQFGWSPSQSEGDVAVNDVAVNGGLEVAAAGDNRPSAGESVIGGIVGGVGESYAATNIRVQPDSGRSFPTIARLRFPDETPVGPVRLQMRLSASTGLYDTDGPSGTHSFVFLRPDGLPVQQVGLDVTGRQANGKRSRISPFCAKDARFFNIAHDVAVKAAGRC
ncbi:hypothetical protein [Streptomyces sp. NPDC015414]|uniref:hypothetical protein n=1 Tax=Streptomyces sp. NPDC015414 TaxID=3364957 RepID=UPI0036FB946A